MYKVHSACLSIRDLDARVSDEAEDVQTAESEKEGKVRIFQVTISVREDWPHRGDSLHDMDLQTYAEYIERRRKPIRGDDCAKVCRDRGAVQHRHVLDR